MIRSLLAASIAASLGACATSFQQDAESYELLDCIGIENEITRQETFLFRARQHSVAAIGTSIIIDEDLGDIDNELALIDEEDALARLQELNTVRALKQC